MSSSAIVDVRNEKKNGWLVNKVSVDGLCVGKYDII